MREERLEAYLNLIQVLLSSSSGEEMEILQTNQALIDAGLVQTMEAVAAMLADRGDGDAAEWLRNVAAPMVTEMGLLSAPTVVKRIPASPLEFLTEVLQATADSNGDRKVVYPLLQANLDQLNEKLAEILHRWAMGILPQVEPQEAKFIAATIGGFSNLMAQFPQGDKANNSEIAISGYEIVVTVFTREASPEEWATTQNNLGNAYRNRIQDDFADKDMAVRADRLERAIACYEQALQIYTRQAFPQDWAMTQNNLGNAYRDRIRGNRADNLERAIACYRQASEIYTREASPDEWATIQNNLALASEKCEASNLPI
ncbi:tetratricopeptide repeat protein [Coleofasciculus sp. FACHB-1120]|nr:tetratricopeptide repeat protein [Coleofasciculus sp. FACHB-1120]